MKRWYPALILLCLLLAGCSGKGEETTFPTQTEAVPVEAAPPAGLHDPDDPVEVRYGDALRAYPLSAPNVAGMKAMGSDLLVFSDTEASTRITPGMLNNVLADAQTRVQPPSDKGRRLKIYYMTQVGIRPPHFVVFCNDARLFHFSYQRYLENCIRNTFGLEGTPIVLSIRQKGDKEG